MGLRLFVIRHGGTVWSRERRYAGGRDIPLSTAGYAQSEAVAQALAGTPIAAVYASPLERAVKSAEAVAKAYALEVRLEPAFREMAFGAWEGLTRDEVASRFPGDYERWGAAPETVTPAGGEELAAVAARVARGVEDLRAEHDGRTVALVTHATVVRLLVLGALGLGPGRLWSIDATPAGISEIEYRDDWTTVHRVNTLAHLDSLAHLNPSEIRV